MIDKFFRFCIYNKICLGSNERFGFNAFSFLIDEWIASIARIEISEARLYDITHHAFSVSRYQHPCDSGDNASRQYPQSLEDESTCYV